MAQNRTFVVWSWFDKAGRPVYVGFGKDYPVHPAVKLWDSRSMVKSDLTRWLREHDKEPERLDHCGLVQFYRREAANVAASLRKRYRDNGDCLLDPRPWGTRSGGGSPRAVFGPDLTVYDSVRHAAVDQDVNPCTITRWCQTDGTGWDYLR